MEYNVEEDWIGEIKKLSSALCITRLRSTQRELVQKRRDEYIRVHIFEDNWRHIVEVCGIQRVKYGNQ